MAGELVIPEFVTVGPVGQLTLLGPHWQTNAMVQ